MRSSWKAITEKLIADEARTFGALLVRPEAKEAFTAFYERRAPDFSSFQ
jgi:hypothetical protein